MVFVTIILENACASLPILEQIVQKDNAVIIVITEEAVSTEFVNVTQVIFIKNFI